MLHIPGLYIAHIETKGRSVFTAQNIQPGEVIEVCPVIMIPPEDTDRLHNSSLHDYYFIWPDNSGSTCIALGYGSIYNHSSKPNADVTFDLDEKSIVISCIKPIAAGDEILIDYQGSVKNAPDLWFDPIE